MVFTIPAPCPALYRRSTNYLRPHPAGQHFGVLNRISPTSPGHLPPPPPPPEDPIDWCIISSTRYVSLLEQTNTPTYTHTHARTDTHHSPSVCQRSLICTQVHDHVRKIEIARYCRHEGIP